MSISACFMEHGWRVASHCLHCVIVPLVLVLGFCVASEMKVTLLVLHTNACTMF